jgi:hypothetical protein
VATTEWLTRAIDLYADLLEREDRLRHQKNRLRERIGQLMTQQGQRWVRSPRADANIAEVESYTATTELLQILDTADLLPLVKPTKQQLADLGDKYGHKHLQQLVEHRVVWQLRITRHQTSDPMVGSGQTDSVHRRQTGPWLSCYDRERLPE